LTHGIREKMIESTFMFTGQILTTTLLPAPLFTTKQALIFTQRDLTGRAGKTKKTAMNQRMEITLKMVWMTTEME